MAVDLKGLAERVKALETKFGKASVPAAVSTKPRKSSDYNVFVKKYITDNKSPTKAHKELFSEAAKAWSESKIK